MYESKPKSVKPFSLKRIFTCSASDYCTSKRRSLSDYELKGVTFEGRDLGKKGVYAFDGGSFHNSLTENFRQRIPQGVEAIVDFKFTYGGAGYAWYAGDEGVSLKDLRSMASGTALIRKIRKKAKKGF